VFCISSLQSPAAEGEHPVREQLGCQDIEGAEADGYDLGSQTRVRPLVDTPCRQRTAQTKNREAKACLGGYTLLMPMVKMNPRNRKSHGRPQALLARRKCDIDREIAEAAAANNMR
jgi:hypothetical protein